MRVLAHVHKYAGRHNAGAEWMLHAIAKDLLARGHSFRAIVGDDDVEDFEGVELAPWSEETARWYEDADVVVTHLDLTKNAVSHARRRGLPVVHLVHNDRQLRFHGVRGPRDCALAVFNSTWLERAVGWSWETAVARPHVELERYRVARVARAGAITLVNLTLAKGAETFYELARRFPGERFLGVRGAYGAQEIPRDLPANVEIAENRPDARTIYRQTRVLLMPSSYESWGRCAIEAAASGIPTIAAPTPGLVESLAYAGTFANVGDVDAWERALRWLERPEVYAEASARAARRAGELANETKVDLARLANRIREVAD